MAGLSKREIDRYDGARWMLELSEKKGLNEARKELEWRGINKAPMHIEMSEIERYQNAVRDTCKKTMCAMALIVLHDEFGMEHDDLERFEARWNIKTDELAQGNTTWIDYTQVLKDECDIDIDLLVEYTKSISYN